MPIDLRVAERDWVKLRAHFKSSFRPGLPPETGAIGVLGESRTGTSHEFLLAKIFLPEPGDLKLTSNGALVLDSSYIRRAHLVMRSKGLAGLITFHTHPLADTEVGFSWFDEEQDPKLIASLQELEPRMHLISVVAGKNSQCGWLWENSFTHKELRSLIVVGERLSYLPLDGKPAPAPPPPAALFDRGLAVTGTGALSRLSSMKIGIVGASGTGSPSAELLARAGCVDLMLIDDDMVKDVNLNRILYASADDAKVHTSKVEVLRRGIEGLGIGCNVEAVFGNVLDKDVLARLREVDVIIGCVDKAYPRLLLSQFAYQYLRPYIDVGAEIGGDELGIVALVTRASYVAAGRHCLQCTGLVTSRQLHFESLVYEEQQRLLSLGYSDDLVMKQPAVMDLNMRAAGIGTIVLRHLLQHFLLEPLPVTISENLVTYTTLPIRTAKSANRACPVCQVNPQAGYGDCGDVIGLDKEMVEAITGPK